jgi:hypothetical protein
MLIEEIFSGRRFNSEVCVFPSFGLGKCVKFLVLFLDVVIEVDLPIEKRRSHFLL